MINIENADDARQLTESNILNEFSMAKNLCDYFDTEGTLLRQNVVDITGVALGLLDDLNELFKENSGIKTYEKIEEVCMKVYFGEKNLSIFNRPVDDSTYRLQLYDNGGDNTDAIVDIVTPAVKEWKENVNDLSTKECGEVVRLFAGLCEAVYDPSDNRSVDLGALIGLKIKKTDGTELIEFGEFCGLRAAYRTTEWGNYAFSRESRQRDNFFKSGGTVNAQGEFRAGGSTIPQNPTIAKSCGFIGAQVAETLGLDKTSITGVSMNRLKQGSVTRGIDHLLGLPEGADVSGTTSDSIFTIETLCNMIYGGPKGYDMNILLLPVAAIVSGYHHTTLECGLALSINGYINYAPGFYTTLQNDDMLKAASGAAIQAILKEFEEKHNHVLIYGDTEVTGCYKLASDDKIERERFQAIFTMRFKNYKCMGNVFAAKDYASANEAAIINAFVNKNFASITDDQQKIVALEDKFDEEFYSKARPLREKIEEEEHETLEKIESKLDPIQENILKIEKQMKNATKSQEVAKLKKSLDKQIALLNAKKQDGKEKLDPKTEKKVQKVQDIIDGHYAKSQEKYEKGIEAPEKTIAAAIKKQEGNMPEGYEKLLCLLYDA